MAAARTQPFGGIVGRGLLGLLSLTYGLALPACSVAQDAGQHVVTAAHAELPDAPSSVVVAASDAALDNPAILKAQQNAAQQSSPSAQSSPQQKEKDQSNAPTLGDLGLSAEQTKPDPDMQARLDRRTEDLKIHQRLGLITLVPLAAACISSAAAPPDPDSGKNNEIGRDIHVSLGSLSVAMYGATAFYAIRAPRVGDQHARGGIKLHKYLIYIHAPGMVLTPILGAMAYSQASNGERVHGIAAAHGAVAWATVGAYGLAILAVSWPIHFWKF